jgi:uracil-DNA glycosylase|tara:strand:- start:785 stop:1468 length:684 start_codon:yes stop_codon:yes gene_type:complete
MIVNNEFLFNQVNNEWLSIFKSEINKKYFKFIIEELESCAEENILCPSPKNIFKAFKKTSFSNLKVVIVGQDPYHGRGQANGLSFAVNNDQITPPSLKNIFNEVENDLKIRTNTKKNLESWADQGVLMLNSSLSVKSGKPNSHQNLGWNKFTDKILKHISGNKNNVVFFLWGNFAKQKQELIDKNKHLILSSSHPSPLSSYISFNGCKHFSKSNKYLKQNNLNEINW